MILARSLARSDFRLKTHLASSCILPNGRVFHHHFFARSLELPIKRVICTHNAQLDNVYDKNRARKKQYYITIKWAHQKQDVSDAMTKCENGKKKAPVLIPIITIIYKKTACRSS